MTFSDVKEGEWTGQHSRDGIGLVSCPESDLLPEIFSTAPAEIFLETKQKYFPTHCFQAVVM